MGTVYQAVCPHCEYQTELYLGCGLSAINLHRNLRVLSEGEQKQIISMEQKKEIKKFHIENKLLECKHCKTLQSRTIIDITGNNDKIYTFGNKCAHCKDTGRLIDEQESDSVICPKCGKTEMKFTMIGLWD